MAIYHLSAQVISRGYGHSAVHAAAYRARCEIADSRTGLVHDYGRKAGELLFEGIYAPKDAPEWARDRAQLWNHVEAFEKHRRAELAREFVIALPHELTLDQGRYALQDWVRENFTRKGLIADVTIHAPGREGDERNVHAHVMVVTRKLDGSEFIRTKERFDTYSEKAEAKKAELETLRESWARTGNRHLERHGFEPSLDHRTLEAQGIEREPTIHMGKAATAIEREGTSSELGDVNREIKVENDRRVIDLAADPRFRGEAMRDAREAARGRVDDIRPPAAAEPAPERAEPLAFTVAAEPENIASTAPERAPDIADGMASMLGKALDFFGGLFEGLFGARLTPAKEPPARAPQQEQRPDPDMTAFREWVRQQEARTAERSAGPEPDGSAAREARLRRLLEEQLRRDIEQQAGDRDDDYSRGYERER